MQHRVVRIIARLNIGGPAIHTILLTSRLPSERYSSLLVKGTEAPEEGDMIALAEQEGVQCIELPELGRELRLADDFIALSKLIRLLWRERPAIVHTHTAKAGALGRLAALAVNLSWSCKRFFGRPAPNHIRTVHTFHGHVFHGYFSPLKSRLFAAIERAIARFTDAVVVISPRQKQDIVETYRIAGSEKVRTIPLGLELTPFLDCKRRAGKLRTELGLDEDVRLIGIVGRLVPIKRHDVLLRALSLLKGSPAVSSSFYCVVVGDGELRVHLEQQVRDLDLSDVVGFLGWRRDLETVYADLDCLVLTSDNEGTPVSVIEALVSEVPVVATAVGGVPDVMRSYPEDQLQRPVTLSNGESLAYWKSAEEAHGRRGPLLSASGLLVPPGDVDSLALALELLWSEPALFAECGRRGRPQAYESFSIERLVDDMDALYQELLNQKAVRRSDKTAKEEAA